LGGKRSERYSIVASVDRWEIDVPTARHFAAPIDLPVYRNYRLAMDGSAQPLTSTLLSKGTTASVFILDPPADKLPSAIKPGGSLSSLQCAFALTFACVCGCVGEKVMCSWEVSVV
jgi:hypothetical protein